MKSPRMVVAALAAALVFLAACASWRWAGSPPPAGRAPDAALKGVSAGDERHVAPPLADWVEDASALSLSSVPARARPAVPPTPEARRREALFYSDMGPDTIDVSAYPAQKQYEYSVYSRACSRCHTLARSINAPLVGRGWWEFYILGMRMRSRREGQPLPPDEVTAILDFLEYDSRVRKVEQARDFDALTEELKSRFDKSVSDRMEKLQKQRTRVVPRPGR